jgi:hypothetical protein
MLRASRSKGLREDMSFAIRIAMGGELATAPHPVMERPVRQVWVKPLPPRAGDRHTRRTEAYPAHPRRRPRPSHRRAEVLADRDRRLEEESRLDAVSRLLGVHWHDEQSETRGVPISHRCSGRSTPAPTPGLPGSPRGRREGAGELYFDLATGLPAAAESHRWASGPLPHALPRGGKPLIRSAKREIRRDALLRRRAGDYSTGLTGGARKLLKSKTAGETKWCR